MYRDVLLMRSVSGVFLEVKLEYELNSEKYNAMHNVRNSIPTQYIKNTSLSVVKNKTTVPE